MSLKSSAHHILSALLPTGLRLWLFWFVNCASWASRERQLAVCLQEIITGHLHRAVDPHMGNWSSVFTLCILEVIPCLAFDSREALLMRSFNTFRPKPPASSVAAQVVIGQHLVISFRTAGLQCFSIVGPEINCASRDWSSIEPSIGMNHIDLKIVVIELDEMTQFSPTTVSPFLRLSCSAACRTAPGRTVGRLGLVPRFDSIWLFGLTFPLFYEQQSQTFARQASAQRCEDDSRPDRCW